jgi:hypothetical protein
MDDKPVYKTGIICTVCLTHDTVALVQGSTEVVWCENGHVLVYDGEPRTSKIVHSFEEK